MKKAAGATTLMGELFITAALIGLAVGLIGFAARALVANADTPLGQSTPFLITPNLAILVIGFAAMLGAAAGLLPGWRAVRP